VTKAVLAAAVPLNHLNPRFKISKPLLHAVYIVVKCFDLACGDFGASHIIDRRADFARVLLKNIKQTPLPADLPVQRCQLGSRLSHIGLDLPQNFKLSHGSHPSILS